MLKNISTLVSAVRSRLGITGGEERCATLARALIGRNGVVIDGDKLASGDPTTVANLQLLLGGTSQIGSLKTIPAGQTITLDANSQDAVYGEFTIYGILSIYGEMRFGPWPF